MVPDLDGFYLVSKWLDDDPTTSDPGTVSCNQLIAKAVVALCVNPPDNIHTEQIVSFFQRFLDRFTVIPIDDVFMHEALLALVGGNIRNALYEEVQADFFVKVSEDVESTQDIAATVTEVYPSACRPDSRGFYSRYGKPLEVFIAKEKFQLWEQDLHSFQAIHKVYIGCILLIYDPEQMIYIIDSYDEHTGMYSTRVWKANGFDHDETLEIVAGQTIYRELTSEITLQNDLDQDLNKWIVFASGTFSEDQTVFARIVSFDSDDNQHQIVVFGHEASSSVFEDMWLDLRRYSYKVLEEMNILSKEEIENELILSIKNNQNSGFLNMYLPFDNDPMSSYLNDNINRFGIHGFTWIISRVDNVKNLVPLAIVITTIRIFLAIKPLMSHNDLQSWLALAHNAFFAVKNRLLHLTDNELKEIHKAPSILTSIAAETSTLLYDCSRLKNPSSTLVPKNIIADRIIFQVVILFLDLPFIELRLSGLQHIIDAIRVYTNVARTKPVFSFGDMGKLWVCNKLEEVDIISKLFSSQNLHVELLRRSVILINFLAREDKIGLKQLEIIWHECSRLPPAPAQIVHNLMTTCIISSLTQDERMEFYQRCIVSIPYSNFDSNTWKFIYQFTVACMEADANAVGSVDIYCYGLELMWEYIADDCSTLKSRKEALLYIVKLLGHEGVCESQRFSMMEKCIVNLEHGKSVSQSLELLRRLINVIPHSKLYWSRRTQKQLAIERLDKTYKIIQLLCDDLDRYHQVMKSVELRGAALDSYVAPGTCFCHLEQLSSRFDFLLYILTNSYKVLKFPAVKSLWTMFVVNSLSNKSRDTALDWFASAQSSAVTTSSMVTDTDSEPTQEHHMQTVFASDVPLQLFRTNIQNDLDPVSMSTESLRVFQAFFLSLNYQNRTLKNVSPGRRNMNSPPAFGSRAKRYKEGVALARAAVWENERIFFESVERNSIAVEGIDFLWRIALMAENDNVAFAAISYLVHLSVQLSPKLRNKRGKVQTDFIASCVNYIHEAATQNDTILQARRSASALRLFLEQFATCSQKLLLNVMVLPPAVGIPGSLIRREWLSISQCTSFHLPVPGTMKLAELRQRICELTALEGITLRPVANPLQELPRIPEDDVETWLLKTVDYAMFNMLYNKKENTWKEPGEPFTEMDMSKTLIELGIVDWTVIKVLDLTDDMKPGHSHATLVQPILATCLEPEYKIPTGPCLPWLIPSESIATSLTFDGELVGMYDQLFEILDGCLSDVVCRDYIVASQVWNCVKLLPREKEYLMIGQNDWEMLLPLDAPHRLVYSMEVIHAQLMKDTKKDWLGGLHGGTNHLLGILKDHDTVLPMTDRGMESMSALMRLMSDFIQADPGIESKDAKPLSDVRRFSNLLIGRSKLFNKKHSSGIQEGDSDDEIKQQQKHSVDYSECIGMVLDTLLGLTENIKFNDPALMVYVQESLNLVNICISSGYPEELSSFTMLDEFIARFMIYNPNQVLRQLVLKEMLVICTNIHQNSDREEYRLFPLLVLRVLVDLSSSLQKPFLESTMSAAVARHLRRSVSESSQELYAFICGLVQLYNHDEEALPLFQSIYSDMSLHLFHHDSLENFHSTREDFVFQGILNTLLALIRASPELIEIPVNKELILHLYNSLLFDQQKEFEEPIIPVSVENVRRRAFIRGQSVTIKDMGPICKTEPTRNSVFALLAHLCIHNYQHFQLLLHELESKGIGNCTSLNFLNEFSGRWNYNPLTVTKHSEQYTGLKNQGATCYMNSLLQQLFHISSFSEALISIDSEIVDESSLLYQLQVTFGSLNVSKRHFYDTLPLCRVIREDNGALLNLSEQKDAAEFATQLFENLEKESHQVKSLLQSTFQGMLVNQVISMDEDNPYASESEEPFYILPLDIKGVHSMTQALDSLVKGEVLNGDNQYRLESGEKVDAIKRTCIKSLPEHLIISLKRFDFDLETFSKCKLNDRFEFPLTLDLEPYTHEYLKNVEEEDDDDEFGPLLKDDTMYEYELAGVIAHSGTSESGHYYSFIRERSSDLHSSLWTEFNDKLVWPYPVDGIPGDCFGGIESGSKNVSQRNAYLLIYDRKTSDCPRLHHRRIDSTPPVPTSQVLDHVSSKVLYNITLNRSADELDIAQAKYLPMHVVSAILGENSNFTNHNYLYSPSTIKFMWSLLQGCVFKDLSCALISIAMSYLLNVAVHGWVPLMNVVCDKWCQAISKLVMEAPESGGPVLMQLQASLSDLYLNTPVDTMPFSKLTVFVIQQIYNENRDIVKDFLVALLKVFTNVAEPDTIYVQIIHLYSTFGQEEEDLLRDLGVVHVLTNLYSNGSVKYDEEMLTNVIARLLDADDSSILKNIDFWSRLIKNKMHVAKEVAIRLCKIQNANGDLFVGICLSAMCKLLGSEAFVPDEVCKWLDILETVLSIEGIADEVLSKRLSISVPKLIEQMGNFPKPRSERAAIFVYRGSRMLLHCSSRNEIFRQYLLSNSKKLQAFSFK